MRFVYIFATIVFLLGGSAAHAQKKSFFSKQGDRAMGIFDYKLAVDYYAAALKHKKFDTLYPIRKTADCYRLLNDPANAAKWYAKLADMPGVDPMVKFYYAEALRQLQNYPLAKKYYESYQSVDKNNKNVADIVAGLDKVQELSKDNGTYKIELMSFNSAQSDFGPAFYGKDSIFFTSNRRNNFAWKADRWSGNDYYQIYKAPMEGGTASRIIKRRPNGRFHDGPVAYHAPSSLLIFTRTNYKTRAKTAADRKTVNLKLFSMVYPSKKRPKMVPLSFNSNEFSNAHPSLSKDGRTLYFCSDRPGGYGGTDIYKSERSVNGDSWGPPVNLGPTVNSKYDEKFPFITEEGVLYFASNALGGLGGLDIYVSHQEDGKWTTPANLGAPINSSYDDFSLIFRDSISKGYFTSNRKGGIGDDDIYGFTKKKNVDLPVTIRVIDDASKEAIDAASIDVPCASGKMKNFIANGFGEAKVMLSPKKTCDATASKDGYENNSAKIDYSAKDNLYIIALHKKPETEKLLVYIKERGTNQPVRDFNVQVTGPDSAVMTFLTNTDGSFETPILVASPYTVSSPDDTNISDAIAVTEKADSTGYIRRTYYIDPMHRKISVPITSDCFTANSDIQVSNKTTGETIKARSDENGKIRLALKTNCKYAITFDGKVDEFETKDLKPGDVINMRCKFVVGQTWILHNIYYDLDKSYIRPDAAKELNKLVALMKNNPSLEIELGSHTDCRQTMAYNDALSVRRAKAAVNYIVSKSVLSRRILAAGYGERHLVNGCACEPTNESPCTKEEHQANRRTEVKVLKY